MTRTGKPVPQTDVPGEVTSPTQPIPTLPPPFARQSKTSPGGSARTMVARRGGGLQMKIRALREGLASLKINYEGVLRAASTPLEDPEDEADDT